MSADSLEVLTAYQRALVAVAVLLDGREAVTYLANDALHGEILGEVAEELSKQSPELRMPYLGSLLRMALAELK